MVAADFLVDLARSGVLEVGAQRRVRGQDAPANEPGLAEDPRSVADHADRGPAVEDGAREPYRVRVDAQLIGVHDAAREHEAVVVPGVGLGHPAVDGRLSRFS